MRACTSRTSRAVDDAGVHCQRRLGARAGLAVIAGTLGRTIDSDSANQLRQASGRTRLALIGRDPRPPVGQVASTTSWCAGPPTSCPDAVRLRWEHEPPAERRHVWTLSTELVPREAVGRQSCGRP